MTHRRSRLTWFVEPAPQARHHTSTLTYPGLPSAVIGLVQTREDDSPHCKHCNAGCHQSFFCFGYRRLSLGYIVVSESSLPIVAHHTDLGHCQTSLQAPREQPRSAQMAQAHSYCEESPPCLGHARRPQIDCPSSLQQRSSLEAHSASLAAVPSVRT